MTNDGGDEGGAIYRDSGLGQPLIPHYYGDVVRRIFIAVSALLLVSSPFVSRDVPVVLGIGVAFALILALLAAITNPQKQWSMMANAVAALFGVLLAEVFALAAFSADAYVTFVIAEGFVIAFLFALYFSVKTVRAMIMDRLGKKPQFGEFHEE